MYNQSNCGCGCNSGFCGGNGCGCNNRLTPIMAPRKVCVTQSCRYVEQPIICPIECRHVQNVVPVPRYYPRYEQTFVSNDSSMQGNMANGACANNAMFATGSSASASANNYGSSCSCNAYTNR